MVDSKENYWLDLGSQRVKMGMGINENLAIDIPQGGSSYPQFPGQIGIWNVGFGGGRKTGGARENPCSKDRNQWQTQSTCDTRSGNQTRAMMVVGKCSHYCAIPALQTDLCVMQSMPYYFQHSLKS